MHPLRCSHASLQKHNLIWSYDSWHKLHQYGGEKNRKKLSWNLGSALKVNLWITFQLRGPAFVSRNHCHIQGHDRWVALWRHATLREDQTRETNNNNSNRKNRQIGRWWRKWCECECLCSSRSVHSPRRTTEDELLSSPPLLPPPCCRKFFPPLICILHPPMMIKWGGDFLIML